MPAPFRRRLPITVCTVWYLLVCTTNGHAVPAKDEVEPGLAEGPHHRQGQAAGKLRVAGRLQTVSRPPERFLEKDECRSRAAACWVQTLNSRIPVTRNRSQMVLHKSDRPEPQAADGRRARWTVPQLSSSSFYSKLSSRYCISISPNFECCVSFVNGIFENL